MKVHNLSEKEKDALFGYPESGMYVVMVNGFGDRLTILGGERLEQEIRPTQVANIARFYDPSAVRYLAEIRDGELTQLSPYFASDV